jgi:hypothetical protein
MDFLGKVILYFEQNKFLERISNLNKNICSKNSMACYCMTKKISRIFTYSYLMSRKLLCRADTIKISLKRHVNIAKYKKYSARIAFLFFFTRRSSTKIFPNPLKYLFFFYKYLSYTEAMHIECFYNTSNLNA